MKMALPVDKADWTSMLNQYAHSAGLSVFNMSIIRIFLQNFILLDFETDSCSQLTRPQVILPPLHIKYDFSFIERQKRETTKIYFNKQFWTILLMVFLWCSLCFHLFSFLLQAITHFNFSKPLFHSLKIEVLEAHTVFLLKVSWHF